MTVKSIIEREFVNGYSLLDKLFMLSMLAMQIIVFAIAPDGMLSFISGVAGVISVVLCAKGKISFYFIGFIQTFTYLYLAWENRFYGEVLENIFYFVTMIWGIFVWKDNSSTDEEGATYVDALKFSPNMWFWSILGTIIATIAMGYWLNSIGSAQAYTDACTNVLAVFAQILMVKRYREQWLWWLVIDVLCMKMWFVAGNWSLFAMYIAWTINCLYGWYNWTKLNKQEVFL